jgi:ATP-dependent RNA helicase DeaD
MDSFEELGVAPELVDALAAEGIEAPTEFQRAAMPVLLRGNPLLAQAGPGAGILVAYGIPLLQRVDPQARSLRGLVLTPSVETASRLAAALSRFGQVTGHRIAALGSGWAVPETSTILFATPSDVLAAVKQSRLSLNEVQEVAVDGFGALQQRCREALETIFESLPKDSHRMLLGQPLSLEAEAFGKAHLNKAVHLPPKAAQANGEEPPLHRGEVLYKVVSEEKEPELLQAMESAFGSGARHALLFFGTEDQAADVGDFLTLHGYLAGAMGDPEVPVWLATNELQARKALDKLEDPEEVTTFSVDVPAEPDVLDRRHGGPEPSMVLVRPRELPHLREVARRTGYTLVPAKEPVPTRVSGELDRLRLLLERALKEDELAPYYLALEPLFKDHSPAEVAAAAIALLGRRQPTGKDRTAGGAEADSTEKTSGPPPKTWVRLFMAVGERDGVGPGDLLGAIAGEAGVEGSQVGQIEIRDNFSLVEVVPAVADKIIRSVNGTTIRGRAVRVDHDRGGPRGRPGPGAKPRRKLKGDRSGDS